MFRSLLLLLSLLFLSVLGQKPKQVCEFENDLLAGEWFTGQEDKILQIHYEHYNLTDGKWTAIAFGNEKHMINLETIIFSRTGDVVTTRTGWTPKKKQVIIDKVPYVTVKSMELKGDVMKVTITRPVGAAGPRNHRLDNCVNWMFLPGGSMKDGHMKKHHGGYVTITKECPTACYPPGNESEKNMMLRSNRIH